MSLILIDEIETNDFPGQERIGKIRITANHTEMCSEDVEKIYNLLFRWAAKKKFSWVRDSPEWNERMTGDDGHLFDEQEVRLLHEKRYGFMSKAAWQNQCCDHGERPPLMFFVGPAVERDGTAMQHLATSTKEHWGHEAVLGLVRLMWNWETRQQGLVNRDFEAITRQLLKIIPVRIVPVTKEMKKARTLHTARVRQFRRIVMVNSQLKKDMWAMKWEISRITRNVFKADKLKPMSSHLKLDPVDVLQYRDSLRTISNEIQSILAAMEMSNG
jgi:hypothetical protein